MFFDGAANDFDHLSRVVAEGDFVLHFDPAAFGREGPVDHLFRNEVGIGDDHFRSVVRLDRSSAHADVLDIAKDASHLHHIALLNRPFEDEQQAGDEVGHDVTQTETDTDTERSRDEAEVGQFDTQYGQCEDDSDRDDQVSDDHLNRCGNSAREFVTTEEFEIEDDRDEACQEPCDDQNENEVDDGADGDDDFPDFPRYRHQSLPPVLDIVEKIELFENQVEPVEHQKDIDDEGQIILYLVCILLQKMLRLDGAPTHEHDDEPAEDARDDQEDHEEEKRYDQGCEQLDREIDGADNIGADRDDEYQRNDGCEPDKKANLAIIFFIVERSVSAHHSDRCRQHDERHQQPYDASFAFRLDNMDLHGIEYEKGSQQIDIPPHDRLHDIPNDDKQRTECDDAVKVSYRYGPFRIEKRYDEYGEKDRCRYGMFDEKDGTAHLFIVDEKKFALLVSQIEKKKENAQ